RHGHQCRADCCPRTMQHSTSPYDNHAGVPRALTGEVSHRRKAASRHRRHSPARCSCRVDPPIRDVWLVDLIRAWCGQENRSDAGWRQERVCGAQRLEAKIEAIAVSPRTRDRTIRYLNARISPQIEGYSSETRKRRFVSDCVVAEAVPIEPVSMG